MLDIPSETECELVALDWVSRPWPVHCPKAAFAEYGRIPAIRSHPTIVPERIFEEVFICII